MARALLSRLVFFPRLFLLGNNGSWSYSGVVGKGSIIWRFMKKLHTLLNSFPLPLNGQSESVATGLLCLIQCDCRP